MKKNQEFTTNIISVSSEGAGIAKIDGLTVFIPYTLPGEQVRIKIIFQRKTYAIGKIIEILTPSPHRTQPECKYYGHCGEGVKISMILPIA